MRSIIRICKKIWVNRIAILMILVFLVVGCFLFDSFISMFYFLPSEGLYNEPPFWLTNALFFVVAKLLEGVKNVVVSYPTYVFAGILFLLAPFYKRLMEIIEKVWHNVEIEIAKLRRPLSNTKPSF